MKLLLLYGVCCTQDIWNEFLPFLDTFEVTIATYPHTITEKANSVSDLSQWIHAHYDLNTYDLVIGHSLGGIIALQLASDYNTSFRHIFLLDSNLKPANAFYRNLMTEPNMQRYQDKVMPMLKEESQHYTKNLFDAIQGHFDFTAYLSAVKQPVTIFYGDRGVPNYNLRLSDLNLSDDIVNTTDIRFIKNACHMIMLENPEQLADEILSLLT